MSKNILANLALRNQVLLDRYKAAQVVEFDQVHKELEKAISETLAAVEVDTLDQLSKAELTGLLKELQVAQTDIGAAQLGALTEQLAEFAGFTAKAEALALTGITKAGGKAAVKATAATAKQAYQRALDDPMNVGKEHTGVKMDGFMKGWSSAQTNMVNGAVLNGWQQGKTVQQVMQQIRGTKAAKYKDGLTAASRRDAAAMVRTATQHVAQAARMETWARNGDLIEGYEILATLDSRTTQICRSMDGRKFDLGKGPFPPFHVNCRTTTVPTLGPEWDFLDEGATRSSANGYVDAELTYYDWLKQQDSTFVKEALGASRSKLFLEGNLTTQQFSDMNLGKNFEPLTLKEMAAAHPTVFKGTGLEKFVPDGAELDVSPNVVTKGGVVPLANREVVKGGVAVTNPTDLTWQASNYDQLDYIARGVKADPRFAVATNYEDLIATQSIVYPEKLQHYLANPEFDRRNIFAIRDQGKLYVVDGHHRLETELLLGNKRGTITVLDYDLIEGDRDSYNPSAKATVAKLPVINEPGSTAAQTAVY